MMINLPEIEEGQGPVVMLNLVRFKDKRIYLEEYVPAFNDVVKQLGITGVNVVLVSDVIANVVAEAGEVWDAVVLVEYPSAEAFKAIATSSVYHALANPLREAATADLKLFMTRRSAL